jgi:hypothetical protein
MVGNVSQIIYFINDDPIAVSLPIYEIIPTDCPNELVISAVTLSNGDILPAAVRFDGLATVDIFETNHIATG